LRVFLFAFTESPTRLALKELCKDAYFLERLVAHIVLRPLAVATSQVPKGAYGSRSFTAKSPGRHSEDSTPDCINELTIRRLILDFQLARHLTTDCLELAREVFSAAIQRRHRLEDISSESHAC
jgi:hypothetical protein